MLAHVEIISHERQGLICTTVKIPDPLMAWRRKQPEHQHSGSLEMFWLLYQFASVIGTVTGK